MPLFVAEEQSRSDALDVKNGKTMNNKSGWLWKKRDYLPGARKRFFTLEGTRLSYHSSKPEQSTAVPRASFDLKGCFAAMDGDMPAAEGNASPLFYFRISFPFKNKSIFLGAETFEERDEWMAAVQCAIILNHFISTPEDDEENAASGGQSTSTSTAFSQESTIQEESTASRSLDTPDAADLSDDPGEDASPGPVAYWDKSSAAPSDCEDSACSISGGSSIVVNLDKKQWSLEHVPDAAPVASSFASGEKELSDQPWDELYSKPADWQVSSEKQQIESSAHASLPVEVPSEESSRPACPLTPLSPMLQGRRTAAQGPSFGDRAGALMAVASAIDCIFPRRQRGALQPPQRGAREWLMVSMRVAWALYLVWCVRPRRARASIANGVR